MTPQAVRRARSRQARKHVPRRLPHRASTTGTRPTRRRTASCRKTIYRALARQRPDRRRATIEQFYDPVKGMFLPDRYIKGECPNCGAKDQYGDACEVCGAVYAPTDLMNPYSALSGATPVLQDVASTTSSGSPTRAASTFLQRLDAAPGRAAARGGEQGAGVARRRAATEASPTGTSRATRPTSASRSRTRRASTSTSGSTRRSATSPASRTTSTRQRGHATSTRVPAPTRAPSRSTSSARTSSTSTRCSGRRCCSSPATARCPTSVYVHGFITVAGEKMSKSRGTGITPLRYLELGHEPGVAALLHRGQAERHGRGHRLQPRRLRRARQQRPGRQVREHREPRGGLHRQALRRQAVQRQRDAASAARDGCARRPRTIAALYEAREFGRGAARDHGARRRGQRIRRRRQAVGAGEGPGEAVALHECAA